MQHEDLTNSQYLCWLREWTRISKHHKVTILYRPLTSRLLPCFQHVLDIFLCHPRLPLPTLHQPFTRNRINFDSLLIVFSNSSRRFGFSSRSLGHVMFSFAGTAQEAGAGGRSSICTRCHRHSVLNELSVLNVLFVPSVLFVLNVYLFVLTQMAVDQHCVSFACRSHQ